MVMSMIHLEHMKYIVKTKVSCGGLIHIVNKANNHAQRSMVVSEMVHANSLKHY